MQHEMSKGEWCTFDKSESNVRDFLGYKIF